MGRSLPLRTLRTMYGWYTCKGSKTDSEGEGEVESEAEAEGDWRAGLVDVAAAQPMGRSMWTDVGVTRLESTVVRSLLPWRLSRCCCAVKAAEVGPARWKPVFLPSSALLPSLCLPYNRRSLPAACRRRSASDQRCFALQPLLALVGHSPSLLLLSALVHELAAE